MELNETNKPILPFSRNVRTIHRLDRATSGVLILVKNFAKTQEMAARIKNHDLRKEYVCRVMGEFPASAAESIVASTATNNSVKEVEEENNDDDSKEAFLVIGNRVFDGPLGRSLCSVAHTTHSLCSASLASQRFTRFLLCSRARSLPHGTVEIHECVTRPTN